MTLGETPANQCTLTLLPFDLNVIGEHLSNVFVRSGFTRVPSMPLARLKIAYASFEEYMQKALNSATGAKLRRKFRAAELDAPIELNVSSDIGPVIDGVYPLYVQVYERSKLHFERLTKEYFCRLGLAMPDKVRFFVWRRNGKAVAFG